MHKFQKGDLKYYYQIHCARQKALGNTPVTYPMFTRRLKIMNLHDAIYKSRVEYQVREYTRTPIQDAVRRKQINKEENIQILDLDELVKLEKETKPRKTNRIRMPKPKQTIRQKITRWIKKK